MPWNSSFETEISSQIRSFRLQIQSNPEQNSHIESKSMSAEQRILGKRETLYPIISLDNREGCKLQMLALCDEARLRHLALV